MESFITGLLVLISLNFNNNVRMVTEAHDVNSSSVDDYNIKEVKCEIVNKDPFEKIRWYTETWEQVGENCIHFGNVAHINLRMSCGTFTIGGDTHDVYYLTVLSTSGDLDGVYTCTYMGVNYTGTVTTTITTTTTAQTTAITTTEAITTTTGCPEAQTVYHVQVISITCICTIIIITVILIVIIVCHRYRICYWCVRLMGHTVCRHNSVDINLDGTCDTCNTFCRRKCVQCGKCYKCCKCKKGVKCEECGQPMCDQCGKCDKCSKCKKCGKSGEDKCVKCQKCGNCVKCAKCGKCDKCVNRDKMCCKIRCFCK